MAKLAGMDLAVTALIRMVDEALEGISVKERKVLFAVGNGTFKSGLNLTTMNTTFLHRLLQRVTKAKERAEVVVRMHVSTTLV